MQNSSAIILAAYAVGAAALNIKVPYDYEVDDLDMDTTWPADDCCRIYRNKQFKSRPESAFTAEEYDWQDICTEGTSKTIDLSSDEHWNDEVQSYKCGLNAWIKFCVDADTGRCNEFYEGESGAGGSESQDIGLHDQHTVIMATWYDPDVQPAATVYSMTECHGHQSIIWMDEGELTTGVNYANLHDRIDLPNWAWEYENDFDECMADPPGIHSVLFPPGSGWWMQLFNDPGFQGSNKVVDETNETHTECNNFGTFFNIGGIYCSGALASSLIFAQSPAFEPIDPNAIVPDVETVDIEDRPEMTKTETETEKKKKKKRD